LPATTANSFLKKLRSQIKGARAVFLLGAGSSYLAGAGYPLSGGLWEEIAGRLDPADAQILAGIIVGRNCGLEDWRKRSTRLMLILLAAFSVTTSAKFPSPFPSTTYKDQTLSPTTPLASL
jgi:hypothetical protein